MRYHPSPNFDSMNASDVCSYRSSRDLRVVPNPAAFFDILSETDTTARSRKISNIEYELEEEDGADKRSLASIFADVDFSTCDEMPMLLRQLAGSIYIEKERLKMIGSLGEGGFAVVHKMELSSEDKTSKEVVAVKKLKPGVIEDDKDLKELIQESNVLRKLKHRGIVQFKGIGCFDDSSVQSMQESIFLAEEFMSGGTLKNVILNQMRFSPQREYWMISAWKWLTQIAEALSYLHMCTPSVIHRDVKPENVLMSSKNLRTANAKIADFGLHKRMNKISQRQREMSSGILESSTIESTKLDDQDHSSNSPAHTSSPSVSTGPKRDLSVYSLDMPSHFRILKKSSSLSLGSFPRDSSLDVVPEDSPIRDSELNYPTLSSAYSVPQIVIREDPSPIRLVFPPQEQDIRESFKAQNQNPADEGHRGSGSSLQTIVSESLHNDKKVRGGQLSEMLKSQSLEDNIRPESWGNKKSQIEEERNDQEQPVMDISPGSSAAYHFLFVPDRSAHPSPLHFKSPFDAKHEPPILESKQHGSSKALDQLVEAKYDQYSKTVPTKTRPKTTGWVSSLSANKLALDLSGTNVVSGIVGSLMYMAPEVYKGKHYDEKVDVFGFGCLMYELFSSELVMLRVLTRAKRPQEMKRLLKRHAKSVAKGHREEIPVDWPRPVRRLIEECWHQDPQQRPSFAEINERLGKIHDEGCIDQMDRRLSKELNRSTLGCCSCCIVT